LTGKDVSDNCDPYSDGYFRVWLIQKYLLQHLQNVTHKKNHHFTEKYVVIFFLGNVFNGRNYIQEINNSRLVVCSPGIALKTKKEKEKRK